MLLYTFIFTVAKIRPPGFAREAAASGEHQEAGRHAVFAGGAPVGARVERFDRRGTEPFEPFEPFELFQK